MKKIVVIISMVMIILSSLFCADIAISISTFTFGPTTASINDGLYANVGITGGISDHLEGELSLISEITPTFGHDVLVKSSLSYALLSPVYRDNGFVPMYINSFIGAGFMGKVPSFTMWGPFITITPLTSGGPQFLRKEKVAALSIYYDIPSKSFGLFFQLFALDIYVSQRT